MEGEHVIDINKLVISMTRELDPRCSEGKIHQKNGDFPLIYRIMEQSCSCDADREVYTPNVLSIGPYHHKSTPMQEIEKMKWDSLSHILELNPKKQMRDYIQGMEGLEQKIRSCYASEIKLNSYDLLKMMLLDGCCLLFVLHGMEGVIKPLHGFGISQSNEMKLESEREVKVSFVQSTGEISKSVDTQDDTFYVEQLYAKYLWSDLLLLENQIPFFVVLKIYQLVTDGNSCTSLLLENIAGSIEDLIYNYPKSLNVLERPKEFHHLLHLCHMYFKPQVSNQPNDDEPANLLAQQHIPCWHRAAEYRRAGIEIKKKELNIDNPHSLLDIGFCNGVMEVPCLTIDLNTYCLFRNLVTFELTCPQFGNYMIAYAVFLSQFISTPDDVSLLIAGGILVHQLNSDEEVCHLFRRLTAGVSFNFNGDNCLKLVCRSMEMHYQIWKPKWRDLLGSIAFKVPQLFRESQPDDFGETLSPEQSM